MNMRNDNLYKFSAAAGIILCLFALYVSYHCAEDNSRRLAALTPKTRAAEIEANHLFQETEVLSKQLTAETNNEYSADSTYIKDRVSKLDSGRLQLNIKYAEIKSANAEIERVENTNTGILIMGIVLFVFGVILFLFGFRNWRLRIQAVQDLALQNELDKLSQEKMVQDRGAKK